MSKSPPLPPPNKRGKLGPDWFNYRKTYWLFLAGGVLTWIGNEQDLLIGINVVLKHIITFFVNPAKIEAIYKVMNNAIKAMNNAINVHALHAGQALIIAIILWLSILSLFEKRDPNLREDPLAVIGARRVFNWWIALVISWEVLFAAQCFFPLKSDSLRSYNDVLNNLEAVCLFGAYFEMAALTLDRQGNLNRNARKIEFFFPIACYVLLSVLELFLPANRVAWGIFSGVLVGTSMAMLISRFSSVYIGAPSWALAILFAYAVTQATYPASFTGYMDQSAGHASCPKTPKDTEILPSIPKTANVSPGIPKYPNILSQIWWVIPIAQQANVPTVLIVPAVPDEPNVFLKFLNIVLAPLKIMMFIFVDWMYNSGKLVYYMGRERRLIIDMDEDWLAYCESIDSRNDPPTT